MAEVKLGMVEHCFADLIWDNAPITTKELVALCAKELNWKRTTTYTVLKKLCDREIFLTREGTVTALISREEFHAIQSEQFVRENFQGSLPAFLAAFTARSVPSQKELEEIKQMIESFEVEGC